MIRKATIDDIEQLVNLKIQMFIESGHFKLLSENAFSIINEEYKNLYKSGQAQYFIEEINQDIVACAGAFIKNDIPYCFFKKPFYGFIGDVYTLPEYRRNGYARVLTVEAINWLKSREVDIIKLIATPEARPLYNKLGFKETDEMMLLFKE